MVAGLGWGADSAAEPRPGEAPRPAAHAGPGKRRAEAAGGGLVRSASDVAALEGLRRRCRLFVPAFNALCDGKTAICRTPKQLTRHS